MNNIMEYGIFITFCNVMHIIIHMVYIYINDSLDASRNNACVFFVCEFVSVCVPCLPNNPDFPEL